MWALGVRGLLALFALHSPAPSTNPELRAELPDLQCEDSTARAQVGRCCLFSVLHTQSHLAGSLGHWAQVCGAGPAGTQGCVP